MNTAKSTVKFSKYFHRAFARNFHASVTKCMKICCCCQQHKRDALDFKVGDYNRVFKRSIENPEDFWAEQADDLIWEKKWDKVLDNSDPPFTKWFVGGELNTCYNAVDRHVAEGNGGQVAIIYDSPVTKQIKKITYRELWEEVSLFAGVLQKNGVQKGDRVLIYMPMIPQAIVAMLASARLGAIHSLVFGGFASKELSTRIDHAKPKVIVSANYGVEPGKLVPYKPLLDGALKMISFTPHKCIIYNRPGFEFTPLNKGRDLDYEFEISQSYPTDCVPVSATDPIYLLYTSGTTGLPKAVVRPSGGHAVVLKWSMWNIYGIKPGEVWWSASDLGWVVGHSYIAYAPLLNCNTTLLFEGKPVGTPDPGVYFRIIKEHNVAGLFVAPTALRAIRRDDSEGEFGKKYMPLKSFRNMFVAGEHCDRETMEWTKKVFNCPVLDNWWQTETGWAITASCVGLGMPLHPTPGVTGRPVPGWNVKVVKDDFVTETKDSELGQIIVKLPLPPGSFSTLWENDYRFQHTYFDLKKNYYNTMDSGYRDKGGYVAVMSRSDDVINVAGHRLSAGALEEAIIDSPYIAEAAVIGVPDELKGEVPLGLCVPKHGLDKSDEYIKQDVIRHVRDSIGPVASFKLAILVPKLPKTRSGKIARNTIAAMAAGKPFKPKVIVSANYGVEPGKLVPYKPLLDGALKMISFTPHKCIIYNRPGDSEGEFGKKYMPLKSFRNMFVAGEHCDRETMEWTKKVFNCPVLDNWWQTETGWAITASCVGLGMPLHPTPGVTGRPVPGWNVKVVKDDFVTETKDSELGQIIVKLPLPPGSFSTLWENDYRFQHTYFDLKKNYYNTMDSGYRDKGGYVAVMSRSDDVINVAGHRLSAGALEEAIIDSPYIAEAAVIGVPDELNSEVPLGLCVPKHGLDKSDEYIKQDVIRHVRDSIGPVASFKLAILVPKLPKTRSGKIARNTIAAMAAGKPFKIPVTIEDESVYPAIRLALKGIGYAPDPPADSSVN